MAYVQNNISLYGLDWAFVFSLVALLIWLTVLLFYVISILYGKFHLHKPRKRIDEECGLELPGVTVAKPLCNTADPYLHDNLTTFFTLDYPKYEIIFCIQDGNAEELIKMINGMMVKYPTVDAKMIIGAQNVGVNPKINNMQNAYDKAQYPLFLISDAGIRMNEDTLRDMVEHMTEKVGLVHQLPYMMDGDLRFSRIVEKVWFSGAHARVYMSANACGVNCMTSMSCLFRKKILDEDGGIKSLSCYLGEDFFLSQSIINKGWHVVLSSQPTGQNPGPSSLSSFRQRMARWMYLRFAAMPQMILLEPITEHILLAPLAALAAQYIFSIPIYITLPLHIVCWCIMDYLLAVVIEGKRPSYSILSHIRAWIIRELLILYLYPNVITMRYVSWGGNKFRVKFGGKTEKVNGDSHSALIHI